MNKKETKRFALIFFGCIVFGVMILYCPMVIAFIMFALAISVSFALLLYAIYRAAKELAK